MNSFFDCHPEIVNRLHDAVISTELDGSVTDCNLAAEGIYGYSRAELIGQSVGILYVADDLPQMLELVSRVKANGHADGEFRNLTKDGREIWIHLSVSLLRSEENIPYGMVGFSIDITAQKNADRAQRESEALNRAARMAAQVGVWYWDLKTGQLDWDNQSDILLDISPGCRRTFELFLSRVHPDDRAQVDAAVRRCLETGEEYSMEYRVQKADGSVRWLASRGQRYTDEAGTPTKMLGAASDITTRKLAEEELARAQNKYRVLFDSPYIGVACGNLDRITDANDTYCRLIGYRRESLVSGAVRWQDITPVEYLERDYACIQEMLETGIGTPFEKEYVRSDGRRIRILLGSQLLSRDPVEWSCFVLDITEHHRALAALRAGEQFASAAKMGSSLAHEINNPLAALTNVLYLLRSGSSNTDREQLWHDADEALERVTGITRQIIGLWAMSEQTTEFRLEDLLEDTIAAYSSRSHAKLLRIKKRNDCPNSTVRAVESDFRRLLSALMENAVEHTPPGGVLQVRVRRGHDWRCGQRRGIKIVLCDNGPGIQRGRLRDIFEPFYTTKSTKGSGLGLWMSRGIIEKYDGRVRVKSSTRPGASGTCVSVFLPERSAQHTVACAV